MFGDSVFDEEDDRPVEERERHPNGEGETPFSDTPVLAFGDLADSIRRREAVAQLLREVGGC